MVRWFLVVVTATVILAIPSPALSSAATVDQRGVHVSRADIAAVVQWLHGLQTHASGARAKELGAAAGHIADSCGAATPTPTCIMTLAGQCLRVFPKAYKTLPSGAPSKAVTVVKHHLRDGWNWAKTAIKGAILAAIAEFLKRSPMTQGCIVGGIKAFLTSVSQGRPDPRTAVIGCIKGIAAGRRGDPLNPVVYRTAH